MNATSTVERLRVTGGDGSLASSRCKVTFDPADAIATERCNAISSAVEMPAIASR